MQAPSMNPPSVSGDQPQTQTQSQQVAAPEQAIDRASIRSRDARGR